MCFTLRLMPCMECAKLIIQSGIRRVVYRDAYRLDDGIKLLKRAGITVEQLDSEKIKELEAEREASEVK